MIVGIGTDIIQVPRIASAVDRWGERILRRLFTEGERRYCLARSSPELHLAARFAAKEAAMKALGTGRDVGVEWKDVEVIRGDGKPELRFTGGARERAGQMGVLASHVSLTHDTLYAAAFVVLEGADPLRESTSGQPPRPPRP